MPVARAVRQARYPLRGTLRWQPARRPRRFGVAAAGGGPIAIRSVTVGTNNGSSATVSATTPTDTAVGDLLIIIHGNDFHLLSNMPTPTVTGSPTVTAITDAVADGGPDLAHIKGYWAVANTSGANTVSVTETGTADEEKCMVVYVLTGADTSDPIDAAANNTGTTTNSQVAPAVSPASSDAYVITHVNSGGGGSAAAYTSPGDVTEQYEVHVGGLSGVGAVKQLAASGSTGTFTFSTGVDSTPYGAVTIAVRTASGAAGVTGSGAVPQRSATTDTGRKQAAAGSAPVARSTTAGTGRKQATSATASTQRSSVVAVGVKQVTATAVAAGHASTADTGRKQGSASAATVAHATTQTEGAPGTPAPSGNAAATQHTTTTTTGRKTPITTATAAAHVAVAAAGRKQSAAAAAPTQRSTVTDTGRKQVTAAAASIARPASQATTSVGIGGAGSTPTHSSTTTTGKRTAVSAAATSTRTATASTGRKSSVGAAGRAAPHPVTATSGARTTSGAAVAIAHASVLASGSGVGGPGTFASTSSVAGLSTTTSSARLVSTSTGGDV